MKMMKRRTDMKKRNLIKLLVAVMVMVLSVGAFAGCGSEASAAEGGTLVLKVNPEIAVDYDEDGKVTAVRGLNEDGKTLIDGYSGFEGKASKAVVTDLVKMMNEAGYFETEVEGEGRQITIEIEEGSEMPNKKFLQTIVTEVKAYMGDKPFKGDIVVEGESNYGVSDYAVSPYGDSNYKATEATTAPAGGGSGSGSYGNTNYGNTNYGNTNYDSNTNYGNSGYSAPAPTAAPTTSGNSDYGNSGYDDGNSGYDDGNSGYDDGDSGYDD